jgi:diketogulonate reductase-like aldo/keto reductase
MKGFRYVTTFYTTSMLQREFGSTGVSVPVIGQGTWKMDAKGLVALRTGIEVGMTHIDTAELYTGAEEVVAKVIRGNRDKIFLVSKVLPSNASYKGTLRACDASLKRLKTDYLDVYLLHWWTGAYPIAETMRAMEELVAAGKIRHIGVSNLDIEQLRQSQKALSREKIVCNQVLYHLRSRGIENRLIKYCESQKIAVVGYSPFGQGDFPSARTKQGKALETIATKHGKSPRQVALNFLTRRKGLFAIPKSGNVDHVRENSGGVEWKLDQEDLDLIDSAFPVPVKDEPLDMI